MLTRRFLSTALFPLFVAAVGCSTSDGTPAAGTGGTTVGTGGNSATGSGGNATTSTGGATGSGGVSTASGGAGINSGGATGTGGTTPTGGRVGTGGTTPTGGRIGAGGTTTPTGGTTGAGGGAAPSGNQFWISPTGSDTNPGTQEAPLLTLCNDDLKTGACYKICPVGVGCMAGGATIWVMDGTYRYGAVVQKIGSTKLGTAAGMYNVFAVAGAKPVFDFTGQPVGPDSRGLQLQGDYWHIKGITVTKAGDTGIFVMGNNNIIEQCVTHHNQDAGLVIGVNSSRAGTGTNNLILNCDSYQNFDAANQGENADGYGLKENAGAGNIFRGCRAWDNGDDGWDFYGWASPVTLENCWAINQTATVFGSASDGNGFKLGGNGVSAAHKLSGLYSVGNGTNGSSGCGFTSNSNPAALPCTGCASWMNKKADVGVTGVSGTTPGAATAAKMIAAPRDANGNLPAITSL